MNTSSMDQKKQSSNNNKSKNKILRLLPKAAQVAVSFQNHQFSPGREKRVDANSQKFKTHLSKGFSGPIFSMIPAEAREKSKNFETQEPTSPKISCMGQIKHKNNMCKQKIASLPKELKPVPHFGPEKVSKARSVGPERISKARSVGPAAELKKKPSGFKQIFRAGRKSDASMDHSKPPLPDRAPSLSQMRRFASSRDSLAGFDWTTARIAPDQNHRDFYSDSDGEDDIVIPFSAPILVSGAGAGVVGGLVLEPRKEINLWKRRTMSQPKPLQLNIVKAQ